MANQKFNSRSIRRGLPVLALAAALGLVGCGGGGDDASSDTTAESGSQSSNSADREGSSEEAGSEPASEDFPKPVAVLPFEVEAPAGFKVLPASCSPGGADDPNRPVSSDAASEDEQSLELKYATWITYAIPDEWGIGGRSSGGSGGVTGTDVDRTFTVDPENSSKGSVKIAVEWDSRNSDGQVTDWNGDEWKTFDYDSKIGDDEARITFENVATVEVGDQTAELFYMDPAQAPEHESKTQYKVRLSAFEVPSTRTDSGGYELAPYSFLVTVTFDAEDFPIDQATVENVVESFIMPECTWDRVLTDHELRLNLDLNDDGHIRNAEDVQKEIQEMMDVAEEKLAEEKLKAEAEG
ncbi:MAG: hypothetical protein WBA45_12060 [Microthrixaceae bacterium]